MTYELYAGHSYKACKLRPDKEHVSDHVVTLNADTLEEAIEYVKMNGWLDSQNIPVDPFEFIQILHRGKFSHLTGVAINDITWYSNKEPRIG